MFQYVMAVSGSSSASSRAPHQLPSGRHGLPRDFVISNQRERLLDAVLQVVESKGYAKMSVEDVIALAGVSRRTFYDHFSNKEQAFLVAYDLVVEQLGAAVGAAYEASAEGWPSNVARGLDSLLRLLAGEPALAHVCIVEVLAAGPNALTRRARTMERFRAFLEPGLETNGVAPRVPSLTAEMVVGGVYEVIYSHVICDRTQELPALLPELLHGLLLPFAGVEIAAAESARARARLEQRAERALAR
jgi:AcrR family transcriptional regulator